MIKRSIHQEDETIRNIHAPNIKAPKHIKQTLPETKREKRQPHNNRRLQYTTFNNAQNMQTESQ